MLARPLLLFAAALKVLAAAFGGGMAGTFLKWLIPGIVVVAGGTALAIAQTGAPLSADLSTRAATALTQGDFGWAHVSIDGRDAVLTGTATTQKMIDDAVVQVASLRGVRAVTSNVVLAEFVHPFPFSASLVDGVISLSGGYPSEDIHGVLLADATGAKDATRLLSGATDPATFEAGARFGLWTLKQFDQGQIQLADLSLSISGRAKSPQAFDALQTLQTAVPRGITLAALKITPPLATPYVWAAKFDGTKVSIAGDAPTDGLADALRALAPASVPVSTSLATASGEPSGFAANALTLLQFLLLLESGEADIKDGTITLSGAPSTAAIADQVTAAVTKIGGTVTLEPPRVASYALSIAKSGKDLTFSGFVPDKATRDKLAALPGADVSKIALGRGAPERFASAVDFGLTALGYLTEGQFDIKGSKLSLGGRADSVADFKAVTDMVVQGAPQGLSLAAAALHPPVAKPFTWSAAKSETGTLMTGYVPDEATRAALHAKIDNLAKDSADPADGAPDDFATLAGKGLDILALLDTGSVSFDGTGWTIDGAVDSAKKGFAVDSAYSITGLRTAGWSYNVRLPKPPVLPTIAPYVWGAQKGADGSLSITGFAPSDDFKQSVMARAANAVDSTVLGAGAPADFADSAAAGLDALMGLDQGSLGLAGDRWTLTGQVADAATRDRIQTALAGKINAANWQIAIQAQDSAPVVTPYLWSATKSASGSIELSGYLPSDSMKSVVAAHAGNISRDTTAVASGEPTGFSADLLAGLDALTHLTDGKAAFDGSKWVLTGDIASTDQGDAALHALAAGTNNGALWQTMIAGYPPATVAPSSSEEASAASSSIATPDVTTLAPLAPSVAPSSSEPSSSAETPSSSEPASSSEQPSLALPSSAAPVAASSSEAPPVVSSSEAPPVASSSEAPPSASSSEELAPQARAIDVVPAMPDTLVFEASHVNGAPITLQGIVPDNATAAAFGVLAGGVKADGLTFATGLPDDFVASGTAGLSALKQLSDGKLGFDGTRWWLRGKADMPATKDAVTASIAALPNGANWSVAIEQLAPLDACKESVGALAKRNAILFATGKATLTANSLPVLDELAGDLKVCPDTYVHVEAHTDADGVADANLALSVARAEAVVAQLIKRGIDEGRLYAEGYGESDPVASNDTKDGKAKNRRVEFEITAE